MPFLTMPFQSLKIEGQKYLSEWLESNSKIISENLYHYGLKLLENKVLAFLSVILII